MPKVKPSEIWRTRDGKEITLKAMEDSHLANSIKMIARNCNRAGYLGDMKDDSNFKKLCREAKRRGFKVTVLNTPFQKDGRLEYVEVCTPTTRSKMAAIMRPIDIDTIRPD